MWDVSRLVDFTVELTGYVHALQKEAGATAYSVTSKADTGSLSEVRRASETAAAAVAKRLAGYDLAAVSPELDSVLKKAVAKADLLKDVRARVDKKSITPSEMNATFTGAIVDLLSFSMIATKAISEPSVKSATLAYAFLLQTSEISSAARANGAVGLTMGSFDASLHRHMSELASKQEEHFARTKFYATPRQLSALDEIYRGAPVDGTKRMLGTILATAPGEPVNVSTQEWLAANTARLDLLGRVEEKFVTEMVNITHGVESAALNALYIVLATAVVLLGFTITMSISIAGSITRPLHAMTSVMAELANGNVDITVPAQDQRDEIGQMAKSVLVFRNAAVEKARITLDAEAARVAAEEQHRSEQENAIAEERRLVSNSIGAGLAKLAAKDLTFRLNDSLPEAYAKLQTDFNHAVEQLQMAMQAVITSSGSISAGSSEISGSSDELSRRTEQQAESLAQTVSSLAEITATGRKAAEGAAHARDVVVAAKADAETTGAVVRQTVEAIGNIEKSAQQINQIIGVIDEIAFQTNLLALNAGVEAARAGEAGRGFAVVASEVRALAQRSANAAKEIKALISNSTTHVDEGVELVAKTGEALERILVQVNEINAVVLGIATGAHEQANGLAQINVAINQMDQVTQQNAAMVEETTAASHSLASEAERLAELMGTFSVGHATTPGRTAARVLKPVGAHAPRRSAVRTSAATLAKAAAAAPEESAWEDF